MPTSHDITVKLKATTVSVSKNVRGAANQELMYKNTVGIVSSISETNLMSRNNTASSILTVYAYTIHAIQQSSLGHNPGAIAGEGPDDRCRNEQAGMCVKKHQLDELVECNCHAGNH